jgi:hypothetical protein
MVMKTLEKVAYQLPKLDVAGSIPVARSSKIRELLRIRDSLFFGFF